MESWLVVSTHLKNISQNWNLLQIGVNMTNIWNHHLVFFAAMKLLGKLDDPCMVYLPTCIIEINQM